MTIAEKKRILLNNIYGVDIDRQAVNVTQLNLLLKALEGETDQTLQLSLFQERVLPQLSHNIKCGNSLIDDAFYASGQATMFPDESLLRRVNAFDWMAEFPQVFTPTPTLPLKGGGGPLSSPSPSEGPVLSKVEGEGRRGGQAGGFDAVIGNPPYIRIQMMTEWAPEEVAYYKQRYTAAGKGNYDIYVIFVEKGLSLLRQGGRLGYILPHKFFNAKYGEPLRRLLAEGKHLAEIIHFGDQQVFANATTYTCLLFLEKAGRDSFHLVKAHDLAAWRRGETQPEGDLPAPQVTASEWNFTVGSGSSLFDRLSQIPKKLEDVTDRIFQGLKTGADKVFIVSFVESVDNFIVKVKSPQLDEIVTLETALLHPLAKGGDSLRFIVRDVDRRIIFPYEFSNGKTTLISQQTMRANYPRTWEYLKRNKQALDEREHGKFSGSNWYGYSRNQALDVISLPKIFTRDISNIASYSLDTDGKIFFTGGAAGGYGILPIQGGNQKYLIGLLNSRLLDWFLEQVSTQMRGGWRSYEARFIKQLPIRTIDFAKSAEAKQHDEMVRLVEQMLALHQKVASAKNPADKQLYQRQIAATDRAIDRLVYTLYNLSQEEIKIVEESRA